MERTFPQIPDGDRVKYISGNPFTEEVFEGSEEWIEEVWRYAWDEELGTVPPRPLTDITIQSFRSDGDFDRCIVHYMQPHFPALDGEVGTVIELDEFGTADMGPFELLKSGVDPSPYWNAYRRNLKAVLDDVDILLNNVSAERVLITADHGNAWGEWGLWGHPPFPDHPSIRRVPWVWTSAIDTNEYTPQAYDRTEDESSTVDERLEALGYRDI